MRAYITGLNIQKSDKHSLARLIINVEKSDEQSFFSQLDLDKYPTIPFESLRISRSDVDLLKMVIMNFRRHRSLNILVAGPVASGKTETVRCIVKGMAKTTLTVVSACNSRIESLKAALDHARTNNSVVLCDDADSILKTYNISDGDYARVAALSEILESPGNFTFFCIRDTCKIDPALLRRFDLILHLPEKVSESDRKRMWAAAVKKYSFEDYFTEEEQQRLAKYPCDAGEIDRVLRNLQHLSGIPVEKMMALADRLIGYEQQLLQELDAELE